MFIQTLGVFIMLAVVGLLILILLYDINEDWLAKNMVILCLGTFWVIALKIIWDFMWFVF